MTLQTNEEPRHHLEHFPAHSMLEQGETAHQSCLALVRNALRNPDQLTAMISNYSTSYNAVNVGIVLPVLNHSIQSKSLGDEIYSTPNLVRRLNGNPINDNSEEEDEQDSIVASSLLAGMILGQLIGGFLGDVLGRRNAMMLVMILQIGGSLGSALFITTDNEVERLNSFYQLAIWRFILGIGAGGVYPLAAVMSAESKQEGGLDREDATAANKDGNFLQATNGTNDEELDDEERSNHTENIRNGGYGPSFRAKQLDVTVSSFQRIALTFSTQGLGFITVPLLAYPMLESRWSTDVIWRALLGVGALPGMLVLYLRLCSRNARGRKSDNNLPERGNEQSIDDEDSVEKATELPAPRKMNEEAGNDTDVHTAISTLFNDITSSDSNGAPGETNENEFSLLENSHPDCEHEGAEKLTGSEGVACNDASTNPTLNHSRGLWESIQAEPSLGRKFAGTAGTWFLFDMLFYGNTLFEPLVLEAAFGSHSASANGYELLQTTVRDSLVISLLSLPGYFITVFLIGRRTCIFRCIHSSSSSTRCGSVFFPCYQTPAFIQMQGFFLMFVLYFTIGLFWTSLSNNQWLLLTLYAGTFFFANYGPNTTTFLLPSITYSEECRSTMNGISAAAGKIGALVGASMFAPATDIWGESTVMASCGCVSLLGWTLTKVCQSGGS